MGNIRLYGSTSGYTELAPPAVAPDGVLALPSGTGTLATQAYVDTAEADAIAGGGLVLVGSASLSGSSVLVTNCFSSAYDNYEIVLQAVNSTGNDVWFRLLNGSTPDTGANYNLHLLRAGTGATVLSATATSQTKFVITSDGQSATQSGTHTIYSPFLAVPTRTLGIGANAAIQVTLLGQTHTSSTSYDGLEFFPQGGTFSSGTVKIYGWRN
jgi:hypothetical protein